MFLPWANFGGKCSSRFTEYQKIFFFKKSWSKIFYNVFWSKWKIDFFKSFKKYLNFHNSYKVNKIMYSLVFCGRWLRIWCYFFNFHNGPNMADQKRFSPVKKSIKNYDCDIIFLIFTMAGRIWLPQNIFIWYLGSKKI